MILRPPPSAPKDPFALEVLAELPLAEALPSRGPARQMLADASYVRAVCMIGVCLADALQYAHRGLQPAHDVADLHLAHGWKRKARNKRRSARERARRHGHFCQPVKLHVVVRSALHSDHLLSQNQCEWSGHLARGAGLERAVRLLEADFRSLAHVGDPHAAFR